MMQDQDHKETKVEATGEAETGGVDLPNVEIELGSDYTNHENSRKKMTALFIVIGLLVAAVLVMGYILLFKGKPSGDGTAQIRQMQQMAQQVEGMESKVKDNQDEMFELMEEYKKKTGGQSLGINPLELGDKERELLKKRIEAEEDVSIKSLLEEVLDKDSEIRDLKARIVEIEKLLPKPHIVKAGEIHYKVAMDFLMNDKQVDKKTAMKLVERAALLETMVPGFKVWNFYTGDAYGTSVTQGTAAVSPNSLIRHAKKVLVDARDEAIAQRDILSDEIKTLEEKRGRIIRQVDLLTEEKTSLISKVGQLNQQVNSLYFLLDSQRSLKTKGILKSGFLRSIKLRDVSPEHFAATLDLRSENQLLISAADLGLRKIKDVDIYPRFYKLGIDYKVAIGREKLTAVLTLLETEKFKNERIVISVK